MSDPIDRACEQEQAFREQAIANQLSRVNPQPFEREGLRLCLDCARPIVKARIAAVPTAVRCIECEQLHERGR